MLQIETVLVPVDFSSSALCAFEFARSLKAEDPDRPTVQIAHAVDPLQAHVRDVLFPYAPLGEDEVEFEYELLQASRRRVREHLSLEGRDKDGLPEPRVELGRPGDLIPEIARTTPADLIVMGAFGQGGVYPDALGCVTERMLRSARQPVLLVRDYDPKPAIRRITVACDLTRSSTEVLLAALMLALATGASLELLYVVPDPLALDTNQVLKSLLKFDRNSVVKRARSRVDPLFDRLRDSLEVPFAVQSEVEQLLGRRKIVVGDPAEAILERAHQVSSDLIVLGSQKADRTGRAQLGKIAHTVARRAPTHVMVVPVDPQQALGDEQ